MERCPYSSCHSCPMEVSLSSSSITEINCLEWYVYVITPFGVVLLIYPPATRGRVRPRGRADKPQHHDKSVIKCYYRLLRRHFLATQPQARVFPCTVRILVRSLPCFVSVSQWRRLLPAFSAPSGLCCRSFPCLTERWTELESENEPPRKRKRLSLRRKENKPITGEGG